MILDFLRANFAGLNDRFDHVDARLDELILRISTLERDVASLSLRVAEVTPVGEIIGEIGHHRFTPGTICRPMRED